MVDALHVAKLMHTYGCRRALLHNLRFDERVVAFSNASGAGTADEAFLPGQARSAAGGGACTAISFRTGLALLTFVPFRLTVHLNACSPSERGTLPAAMHQSLMQETVNAGVGIPLMAAGGGAGAVTIWNLEERRLHTVISEAHDAPITALHFFPGEPRLMSAGRDNALKQWVLDSADGAARLLRFRSGHAAPPTCLMHYGEAGTRLLSAGAPCCLSIWQSPQYGLTAYSCSRRTGEALSHLKCITALLVPL